MQLPTLWIVCPSFRDVPSFLHLRRDILAALDGTSSTAWNSVRFVLIDDTGGIDPAMSDLSGLGDCKVIAPPFNLGHQRAIVFGLRTILDEIQDDDTIVTMDSDGEDRAEDVARLLAGLNDSDAPQSSLSIALRTKRSESLSFKVFYRLYRAMFRTMTGTTVRSGNFAAYRGWLARRILLHPFFDLCYSSSLISLNINRIMVPCARGDRYEGRSRMGLFGLLMHGIRMLMPFTDRIAVRALAAFSVLTGLGVFMGLGVLAVKFFTALIIPAWLSIAVITVLVLSIAAFGNFVVLFTVFSHSRGIALSHLEDWTVQSHSSTVGTEGPHLSGDGPSLFDSAQKLSEGGAANE